MGFREYLIEGITKHVYIHNNTLWVAHAEGSGATFQLGSRGSDVGKFRGYITDKPGHDNESGIVGDIVKWAVSEKPEAKKGENVLYKIPVYISSSLDGKLDIWKKELKQDQVRMTPVYYMYMFISRQKYYAISFFKSKQEAMSWMNN